jgi:hypothetical protein
MIPTREGATQLVAVLQDDPLYYRNFGPFWWAVKRWLKRLGFTRQNIRHLGDYDDPGAARWYKGQPFLKTIEQAFDYQAERAVHSPASPFCQTPDGDDYILEDQDAE